MFCSQKKVFLALSILIISGPVKAGSDVNHFGFDPFGHKEPGITTTEDLTGQGPVIPEVQLSGDNIALAFRIVSDATGWSIFSTQEVSRATVSLWAKDITAKELLDRVVELAGFVYHRDAHVISVMTYDEYMRYYGLAKKVVPLKYAEASALVAAIKPFMTKLGKSVVHTQTNTIVIYETKANLNFLQLVIEKLDTPSENVIAYVIELQYLDCIKAAEILNKAFAGREKNKKNKSKQAPAETASEPNKKEISPEDGPADAMLPYEKVDVFPLTQANRLLIIGRKSDVEKVQKIVDMIDVYGQSRVITVIDLHYADAQMVEQTLNKVFLSDEKETQVERAAARITPSKKQMKKTVQSLKAQLSIPEGTVEVYSIGRTNQLIVKAFKGDLEKIKQLISKLDVFVEPITRSYSFTYVDASQVYQGLKRILDIYGRYGRSYSAATTGQQEGYGRRGTGLTLVERTNSILLTGPPSKHRIMSSIKQSIDVPGKYEAGVIQVYKVENADVKEIAKTLRELIEDRTEKGQKPGEPKFGQTTKAPEQTAIQEMTRTEKFAPRIQPKVSVNMATNSIIVLATARQHREIAKLITELDIRRKQVLIKAVIVEVTTSDNLNVGIELGGEQGDFFSFTSFGLSNIDPATGERQIIVSPGGSAAVLSPPAFRTVLKALQSCGSARIESAPQILVNDNAVGTIQSISEEPTTQTNLGETTTTTSFAGFVEAGTTFAITPHIGQGDYLRVVYQITLNSFGSKPTDPSIPPPRKTSNIQSEATVPDGSTIVVGGIQSKKESKSVDKIPILGDIPLIGLIFRNTMIEKKYITTYLFITTSIMKSEDFSDLKDVSENALNNVNINSSTQIIGDKENEL